MYSVKALTFFAVARARSNLILKICRLFLRDVETWERATDRATKNALSLSWLDERKMNSPLCCVLYCRIGHQSRIWRQEPYYWLCSVWHFWPCGFSIQQAFQLKCDQKRKGQELYFGLKCHSLMGPFIKDFEVF